MPECLKVYAKDERIERLIGDRKELMKIYGAARAAKIQRRVKGLRSLRNLQDAMTNSSFRFHALHNDRYGQLSVKIDFRHRMVLEITEQKPTEEAGGLSGVVSVTIKELCVNYHT